MHTILYPVKKFDPSESFALQVISKGSSSLAIESFASEKSYPIVNGEKLFFGELFSTPSSAGELGFIFGAAEQKMEKTIGNPRFSAELPKDLRQIVTLGSAPRYEDLSSKEYLDFFNGRLDTFNKMRAVNDQLSPHQFLFHKKRV